jgi:non-ribosomal peptide synthetase component F
LSAAERRTILQEWTATERALPGATLPQLFAAQAAATPDAVAVVFAGEELSYGELDGRANQLAHHLRALGVGAESVVGVCLERSLELVVALLGILKAGGGYLPLDPEYPAERLSFMLADAGAAVLITQWGLRGGGDRGASQERPRRCGGAAQPRLRHLYLRLHRNPQRRRGHPWRHTPSCRGADRSLRHHLASARASIRFAEL